MARAPGVTRSTMLWEDIGRRGLVRSRASARFDRVGRRPVYLFGALFSLVYSIPFFWLLDTRSEPIIWAAIVLGVVLGHNAMAGPQAAYFSELFGVGVRYRGPSLAYQLASVAAGGLAPFIATALLAAWGVNAVAGCMMLLAGITVAATYAAPETHREARAGSEMVGQSRFLDTSEDQGSRKWICPLFRRAVPTHGGRCPAPPHPTSPMARS